MWKRHTRNKWYSQLELRIQAFYTIITGNPDYNLCKAYMPYDCHHYITKENFDYKNPEHIKHWGDVRPNAPHPSEFDDGMEEVYKQGWSVWIDNKTNEPWIPTDLHSKITIQAFPDLKLHTPEFKKARYLGKATNFAESDIMIKTFICKKCGVKFQKKTKSYAWYCETCRKKRNVEINMQVKKRKIPSTEIGVGSGNSSKNKSHYNHPSFKTGIQAYRNIYKDSNKELKCELCGSDKFLCIHHKDHNRQNNLIDNLQCLCKSCHQKHHIKRNKKGQFTAN